MQNEEFVTYFTTTLTLLDQLLTLFPEVIFWNLDATKVDLASVSPRWRPQFTSSFFVVRAMGMEADRITFWRPLGPSARYARISAIFVATFCRFASQLPSERELLEVSTPQKLLRARQHRCSPRCFAQWVYLCLSIHWDWELFGDNTLLSLDCFLRLYVF